MVEEVGLLDLVVVLIVDDVVAVVVLLVGAVDALVVVVTAVVVVAAVDDDGRLVLDSSGSGEVDGPSSCCSVLGDVLHRAVEAVVVVVGTNDGLSGERTSVWKR